MARRPARPEIDAQPTSARRPKEDPLKDGRRRMKMLEDDHQTTLSPGDRTFAFPEICRAVLNPRSFSFVVANAPSEAVNSFEVQRQRLASVSLRVASLMLLRRLRATADDTVSPSLLLFLRSSLSSLRSALLLGACALGQLGLGVLRLLRHGIPPKIHLWASANILRNVGTLLTDSQLQDEPTERWKRLVVTNDRALDTMCKPELAPNVVAADILRALTASLPTDLSRLIFLATLRDNNSGHYYHPEVARRFSEGLADQAMLACHQNIYRRVVALAIEDLTDELEQYIATVPAPRERLIESWKKLKAYRATIPIDADTVSAEIFFMKVEVAVAILESRLPGQIS
jgi:hypothetical protein